MMTRKRIYAAAAWLAIGCGAAWAASDEVKIDTGRLKGAVSGGVVAFKGIPYAAPPTGALRWRPPQPAAAWSGVRDAAAYGADCMQLPFPGDAAPLGVKPAEDCLYANVWAPAGQTGKTPVLVWIYGGGFVNGGSSPAVYDGSAFARRGLVFVSFNYRLGRFGFFAHPALSRDHAGEPHGNYGFMDQIAALKWVKRNIAAFGGDPAQVTVFGESAGGGSVLMLLTSPMAKGLFARAVIESGGGRGMLAGPRYLDKTGPNGTPSAEEAGVSFAEKQGVSGEGARALAMLRALPAAKVVDGLNMATMFTPTYAGPLIDGKVVVDTPDAVYAAGHGARVPVMIGANSMDIGFARGRTMEELFAPFGAASGQAIAAYDPGHSGDVRRVGAVLAADEMMVEPARFVARTIARLGLPAYEYRFSYVAASMRAKWPGAPHASEIPYVFDTVAARYGKELAASDEETAKKANAYWANFARKGDPNGEGLPDWPAYSAKADRLLNFTEAGPEAMADPLKNRLDLVSAMAQGGK